MTTGANRPELVFTPSGEEQFTLLQRQLIERLRDELEHRNAIPGERVIEITGSDVQELARSHRLLFASRSYNRRFLREIVIWVYMFAGLVATLGGLYYTQIRDLLQSDPPRLMLIAVGITMTLLSFILRMFYRRFEAHYESEVERVTREQTMLQAIISNPPGKNRDQDLPGSPD